MTVKRVVKKSKSVDERLHRPISVSPVLEVDRESVKQRIDSLESRMAQVEHRLHQLAMTGSLSV
jgi:hypothetical protein